MEEAVSTCAIIYERNEILYETELMRLLDHPREAFRRDSENYFSEFLQKTRDVKFIIVSSLPEEIWYVMGEDPNRHDDPNEHILEDLHMIEVYSNIKDLEITCNFHVRSLDGISSLINLESLTVGTNCRLQNLHGLEFCHSLRTLRIPINDVADLSPVMYHPLRCLNISFNPVSTLAGMNLTCLKKLIIDPSQYQLLEDLEMPALKKIILRGDAISKTLIDEMLTKYGSIVKFQPVR